MKEKEIFDVLQNYKNNNITIDQATQKIQGFKDIGFATIDLRRKQTQGFCEVIYGAHKTAQQVLEIAKEFVQHGEHNILCTRISQQTQILLKENIDCQIYEQSRVAVVKPKKQKLVGNVVIVCAGTSDLPVAQEAQITAQTMGAKTSLICDVGVAGIHRLLSKTQQMQNANVCVVVAGMEGALPSVVAGLIDKPVIAVPTSVGYGASFSGLAALLSMLNSCASGVSVVNIDNGFGAAFQAVQINRLGE